MLEIAWMKKTKQGSERRRERRGLGLRECGAALLLVCAATMAGNGQNSPSAPSRPKITLLSPEANRPPDANAQMTMRQKDEKNQNFDQLNAERIKQIDDDATKLLILTKDLNQKMSKLGKEPMPPNLVREAEVIEILAHDVEAKMTLTVGAT